MQEQEDVALKQNQNITNQEFKLDWLPFILLMIYWVFIIGHFIKQSLLTQLILVDLLF